MHALSSNGWTGVAAAWLVNYLVHSTVLLGAAWLASRWLAGRNTAAEEWIWRSALAGGLITASLQLALGGALAAAPVTPPAARTAIEQPAAITPLAELTAMPLASGTAIELRPTAARPAPRASSGFGRSPSTLPALLLALWAAGAAFFSIRLTAGWIAFRRRLTGRRPIAGGPLTEMLDDLAAPALAGRAVRLTSTRRFAVPFARGLARPEICMPERAVSSLHPTLQQGILAHEVAHLVRRDPLWLAGLRMVEALFFFQPLHRLASRRLLELSEFHCDDWAARATGRGKDLARSLTEVATWLVKDRYSELPVPAMGRSRSNLARRIERLLASGTVTGERGVPRWALPASALVLTAVVAFAPGLTLAGGASEPQEVPVVEPVAPSEEIAWPVPEAMPEPAAAPEPELPRLEIIEPLAPMPEVLPIELHALPEALPALAPLDGDLPEVPGVIEPVVIERMAPLPGIPAPHPVIAEAWGSPPPPPMAPPSPRAPRAPRAALPPGHAPEATPPPEAPPAPGAPPAPPAPGTPRAPRAWHPGHELAAIAHEMEALAAARQVPAVELTRLLRQSARVALRADAISIEEHDRMVEASAARAAEASRSPAKVAQMAAETRALAESMSERRSGELYTPRPPGRDARAPRAHHDPSEQYRHDAMEDARRQAIDSLADQREAIEDAVADAQRQALVEVRRNLDRQQVEIRRHLAGLDRELAGQRQVIEQQVRGELERELARGGKLSQAEIDRALAEARSAIDQATAEAGRAARESLERAVHELERTRMDLDRSRNHHRDHATPHPPRPPRAESTPAPDAPEHEVEEPIEPPAG